MNLVKRIVIGAGLLFGGLFALAAFLALNPSTRTWISARAAGEAAPGGLVASDPAAPNRARSTPVPAAASAPPRTPPAPPSSDVAVNGVSRAWLIGSWAYGDMCETDVSVHYNADGTVNDFGANGRWTLKGDVVTQYIDEEYELGEEQPSARYSPPDVRRFRIQRLGPRKARVGAGEDGLIIKCS